VEQTIKPSTDFGNGMKNLLAEAGTVTLPWPPPASGPLFMGINPDSSKDLPSGSPRFFLKSVQTVSPRQVITRITDLRELRAVSLPGEAENGEQPPRVFKTVNGIAGPIERIARRLEEAADAKPGVYEELLFSDAVIYVRETAPVLVRIEYEFGVTAADAAENVDLLPVSDALDCCKK
jgi:hypothetical protein